MAAAATRGNVYVFGASAVPDKWQQYSQGMLGAIASFRLKEKEARPV